MKLHLRLVRIGDRTCRLVTLRSGTDAAFSTNYYHGTWHILSDDHGAKLLARLLWGLAYQRQPGTMIVLHGEHLKPTPFDAERSDPIVLVSTHLATPDADLLRGLKARLEHLEPPTQTIVWQTFGLNALLEDSEPYYTKPTTRSLWYSQHRDLWHREQMRHCGGCLLYMAPAAILCHQALRIHGLETTRYEMAYHYLAERRLCYPDGEVQVFRDYRSRLSTAGQARREVLSDLEGALETEPLRQRIYRRRHAIEARHRVR